MDELHPALIAARNSWRCVQAKLRDEWLDLMADDILIEDPIGIGPTNPTGQGQRGREAAAAFWDQNIGPSAIQIEIHESCVAGLESAHLMTLRARLANGIQTAVRGIFTYRVDEAGKLDRLRGYWTLDAMKIERPQAP
jgi:steroid delta-isomerase